MPLHAGTAIDCAYAYGNENEVDAAIKTKIEDGTVKRELSFHDQQMLEHLP